MEGPRSLVGVLSCAGEGKGGLEGAKERLIEGKHLFGIVSSKTNWGYELVSSQ
jgi:hypothetical protein